MGRQKSFSQKGNSGYLNNWIKDIAEDETALSIRRHIIFHAKEVYKSDPREWAASMRNLLDIFEIMHKVTIYPSLRLERLYKKYKKNPRRYTPPPKLQ